MMIKVNEALDSTRGGRPQFAATQWGMIAAAAGKEHDRNTRSAFEDLYRAYSFPIYAFIRRRGYARQDAQDLTQDFFLHLLEKDTLARADATRGKFRTFLLGALEFFLSHAIERARTQKRGGQAQIIFLDQDDADTRYQLASSELSAQEVYEVRWAAALISAASQRLQERMVREKKGQLYEALQSHILGESQTSYQETADQLGISMSALKTIIHRLRVRYRNILREEVARTVSEPHEVEDELTTLRDALRSAARRKQPNIG